jgi:hypothetical protein
LFVKYLFIFLTELLIIVLACTQRPLEIISGYPTFLDHSGNAVGGWYSAIRAAAVEVNENGQIVNLSPQRVVTRGSQ